MPDEPFVYNIIRFKNVPVMLDGTFVWTTGLEPNINSFVCAAPDFAALLSTAGEPGDLEFFYNRDAAGADPGSPLAGGGTSDLRFQDLRMVSWTPVETGSTLGNPPTIGPVKWRIRLADFRERFVKPRGGWLVSPGVINAKSAPPADRLENSDLMFHCLRKMRSAAEPPVSVNEIPAPTDLKWQGSHAPTELDELLERVGAVACPRRDGRLVLEMIGEGDVATAPTGRGLATVSLEGQDRRGKTVIFTSYPNAIVERMKLDGPSDDTWQYVAPDPADFGKWKKLADIPLLGGDPLAAFRSRFGSAGEQYASFLDRYVYSCIRLNPTTYGRTPLLRLARRWHTEAADNGTLYGVVDDLPIEIYAKRIIELADGSGRWKNPADKVLITPSSLAYGAIIKFPRVLMKLETDTQTVRPDFREELVPLGPRDMTITFGREEIDPSTKELKYFQVGYRADAAGTPQSLSENEVTGLLASGDRDVIVIDRPDWVLYKQNNEYVNLPRLKEGARATAARMLKGSGEPAELRSAVGWFPVELSGKVAEIRLTQEPPMTEWRVNTWWLSQDYYLGRLREKARAKAAGNATPNQQATQGERRNLGANGEVQPEVILNATPEAPPSAVSRPMVKPTRKLAEAEGGWYEGVVLDKAPVVVFTAGRPLGQIGGDTEPCLIGNTMEQDRRLHRVVLNRWYPLVAECEQQPAPDGRRTVLISVDPDVVKDLKHDSAVHQVQVAFTTNGDDGWHDKIPTKACPPGGGS